MVYQVNDGDDYASQLESAGDQYVIVDFYATWCGPCKMIAPHLDKLAAQYPNIVVIKVDVDECEDLATEKGVEAMPTFIVYHKKAEVERVMGANKEKVIELFKKYNK